jgi:sugar transferase (PEP-CTERM/EpsH1 system associated)
MRILYVTQRVPFPPNRGDKIASYHAIRHLAQKHDVHVAALADSATELEHAEELRQQGIPIEAVLRRPGWAKVSVSKALLTGQSFSVAYYSSRALASRIARLSKETPFDVVITFSSSMGQYVDQVPGVPLVADFVDMDSRKWDLYTQFKRWPRSWLYATEARRLLEWERRLAARASCTLVRTQTEQDDCARLIPGPRFEVLSNGVDLEFFSPDGPNPATCNIVFTGVMDYFPNVQGVLYFCNEVLPVVRQAVPEATFTIVGARPSPEVLALRSRPGVVVTGQVPDVRPYLREASVAVTPLLLSRGIQNKILEAMAMALPVVASRTAFHGVDGAEEAALCADSAGEFAEKVTALLQRPKEARESGLRGRSLVERRYVWGEQLARLDAILHEVVEGPRQSTA